jgi:O-acetyl-ADP-ribose deacetylase (regulator of RNase III)
LLEICLNRFSAPLLPNTHVLEFISKFAVRPDDLLQYLNQHRPQVVHFSGHGSPTDEIILLDGGGEPKPVSKAAIQQLFKALKYNIRLIVLDACFSHPQAEAITEVIDCAVGMKKAIGDKAAIVFAGSFYRAIGFGNSVQEAFDHAKTALMLEGIAEENIPELLVRQGIDPTSIFLVRRQMANKRSYRFGTSLLSLEFGDITTSKAQVLVSSDDYYLSMGGGVSRSILNAGGHAIALDASKKVPAAVGDVVVTTAGTLAAQYIFHAITLGPDLSIPPQEIIKQSTKRCMQMLDTLQLSSIAFPAIGTGSAGFSNEDAAVQMAAIICEDLLTRRSPVEVTIYLFDQSGQKQEIDHIQFFEEIAARVPRLTNPIVARETKAPEERSRPSQDDVPQTDEQIRMRRINNLRKLIGAIEDRRFEIEAQPLLRSE